MYPHPYSQITVETEFDNPLYETGGVRISQNTLATAYQLLSNHPEPLHCFALANFPEHHSNCIRIIQNI